MRYTADRKVFDPVAGLEGMFRAAAGGFRGALGLMRRDPGVRQEDDRLWQTAADLQARNALSGARVALLGFDADDSAALRAVIREAGVVNRCNALPVGHLGHIGASGNLFSHVVVNLDAFEDLETAVTRMISYRQRCPQVGVILMSDLVSGDDFGSDRRPIADVTLRAPVTVDRMRRALRAASEARRDA